MPAQVVSFGEPAVGVGGEFEIECTRILRDSLPSGYVIATNVNLARGSGHFYECDIILSAPGLCDILELKCIRPDVTVWEDLLACSTGFTVDRVLSILDHKGKVLATRRGKPPFPSGSLHKSVWAGMQIVVPSDTRITFRLPEYAASKPVMTLDDTVKKYQSIAAASSHFSDANAQRENLNAWVSFRDESAKGMRRNHRQVGRFIIRRQLRNVGHVYEYFAVDERPCQMEVQLREFPFDAAVPALQLQRYLQAVARESRVLMKLRHPNIMCVIGHFQTGASWVQVSDWFEGNRLEDVWPAFRELSIYDKVGIFEKVLQAIQYCHERGVFHRNIGCDTVRVSADFTDVRVQGFDCALDLEGTASSNSAVLSGRDGRLIPPEDLLSGTATNPRLSDVFQSGVLLYRLLENGNWPFSNTFEYSKSGGQPRPFSEPGNGRETEALRSIALQMIDAKPNRRPDLLCKIEQEIKSVFA